MDAILLASHHEACDAGDGSDSIFAVDPFSGNAVTTVTSVTKPEPQGPFAVGAAHFQADACFCQLPPPALEIPGKLCRPEEQAFLSQPVGQLGCCALERILSEAAFAAA